MKLNKHFYKEIDSTNQEAKRLIKQGAKEGTVIIAEEQSAGYGKFKSPWFSPKGQGLYFSIVLYPGPVKNIVLPLSLLGARAACQAITKLTGLPATVKPPNDVMVKGKKVGGVLVEVVAAASSEKAVIIGIGINVNIVSFPEELKPTASSLKLELGKELNNQVLLELILEEMKALYVDCIEHGW